MRAMQASTLVLFAHPYPDRSRAGAALLAAVRDLPFVQVRALYDLYPDFFVDVAAEQAALTEARVVVLQCPFYWYGLPAMMHQWIEKVLAHGWAYGHGARAVAGKRMLWVTSTGAPPDAFQSGEMHGHPFAAFVPPVQQTATFCGMHWEEPFVVHGAHRISKAELSAQGQGYRERLIALDREVSHG